MTPTKIRQWVDSVRSQESGYAFSEALAVGDEVPGGDSPLPRLEVLATVALDLRALRVHSLHVRAATRPEDPDGLPIHVMRLLGVLEDGDEIELLREAIPGPAEGAVDAVITCIACEGRIWDHEIGEAVPIDGQLYHQRCVVGGHGNDND